MLQFCEDLKKKSQQFFERNHSFHSVAADWWNEEGPMKPLHQMNACRMGYIVDEMRAHLTKPMSQINVLDVGCGGGIACEALANLGCQVTGIDLCEEMIQVAKEHAEKNCLKIEYECCKLEDLADQKFDLVLCLEVLEHVPDPEELVRQVCQKTAGISVFSTLNRTKMSFILSIVMAEYVLRWLPRGTHDWKMYVRPSQLEEWLLQSGFVMSKIEGMNYNPLFQEWRTHDRSTGVNYIATGMPTTVFDTK